MNKALISLITDTNELDRLRNNGAEYIKQFSMDNVMERWILLLNELQK
jgi:hypothetical protein